MQVSDQAYRAAQWEVERILRRQGKHHIYASESEMLSHLDRMTAQGFRFQ